MSTGYTNDSASSPIVSEDTSSTLALSNQDDINAETTILLVDDHHENLRMLSLILQAEGYKVRKASSGAMALETVQFLLPDLILLDIRMPKMDGFEVCTILKQFPATCEIPILFISASDDIDDKVKAFEVGGADYITKPFRSREVIARIRHQLIIRQQRQELTGLYQQIQQLNTTLEQQVQQRTQELQAALEKLQQVNQLKDEFLSTISHELRTPIANIRVVLQLLMMASQNGEQFFQHLSMPGTTSSQEKITQYLNILNEECDRELHLIQDLLDLQYLAADAHPLAPTTINLYEWVPHLLEPFQLQAQQKQQTLSVHLVPDLPLYQTDTFSLNQILTELLTNACKYTPVGETITLEVREEWQGEREGQPDEDTSHRWRSLSSHIVFRLTNSGVEIPSASLPHIFDKFYRIPGDDPYKHSGTGLGLALLKKRVEHLQGSIDVISAQNSTCFTIKLPHT